MRLPDTSLEFPRQETLLPSFPPEEGLGKHSVHTWGFRLFPGFMFQAVLP